VKKFENRSIIIGKDVDKSKVPLFYGPRCILLRTKTGSSNRVTTDRFTFSQLLLSAVEVKVDVQALEKLRDWITVCV